MCIIILNLAKKLPEHYLYDSWENNPDGAGLAYVQDGKLVIEKELRSDKNFVTRYNEIRELTDLPILLHFRIATSGNVNEANCHPFMVNKSMCFAHNGIISHTTDSKSDFSDTILFNNLILKKLPHNFLDQPHILELLRVYISSSKLVFLKQDGTFKIINEKSGHWDKDKNNWFSNKTYLPVKQHKALPAWSSYQFPKKLYTKYGGYGMENYCEYCGAWLKSKFEKDNQCCNICYQVLLTHDPEENY